MESLNNLTKREHFSELILIVLIIVYLILGIKTPELIAKVVDTLIGKIGLLLVVVYLCLYSNPILAVMFALFAYDLIRRSELETGIASLDKYAPSEKKKMSHFSAFNQFPYTLEQEVVAKMAPLVHSGTPLTEASYKPLLEDTHNATKI